MSTGTASGQGESEASRTTHTEIRLSLPGDADWLGLARTTSATVASRADFSYEEIADLRLAIDELCLSLLEHGGSAERIELVFTLDDDVLRVDATIAGKRATVAAIPGSDTREFSERILDALVDTHGREEFDGANRAWLVKHKQPVEP